MLKRIVEVEEEERLVDLILDYALKHRFTKSNINEAVERVMQYMDDNAILGEVPACGELLPRENQ